MRKIYQVSLVIAAVLGMALSAHSQTRVVRVPGWDPASGESDTLYNNVLYDAIMADSTERETNPDVVFELVRNHKYPLGKVIENYDFHLWIRAEEGEGLMPELVPGKRANGTYGADYIYAYNDMTLEEIAFNAFTPDGSYLNRMIEGRGTGMRMTVRNCSYDGDRGSCVVVNGDSMSIFLHDVRGGNTGHRKTTGGNGRLVDFRPTALYVDTIVIQNSTTWNSSDRIIRNMGTVVNYLLYDHVTALNIIGFHGGLQLGHVRTAIVTNNIFGNVISLGHTDSRTQEQTQPEKHFAAITLDTVFAGQVIEVRNNNIYWDQELVDVWAKYDSVEAPWPITPTIETAIGAANVDAAWFAEPLTYTAFCGPISAYVDAYYADPAASSFPENWCVGGEGGYFPDQLDASYPTTAASYTAADKGYPLGDLNYFPEMKAMWETGVGVGIEEHARAARTGLQNYPNPFSRATTIAYEIGRDSDVTLEVYDITGRKVRSVVDRFHTAGSYQVTFDAEALPAGLYFYRLDDGSKVQVNNMIISK